MPRKTGDNGNNIIYGDFQPPYTFDELYGLGGNDQIYGLTGIDLIYGGQGDDYIVGGDGVDTLYGDDGNDTFFVENLTFHHYDNYYGGTGYDVIETQSGGVTIMVGALEGIEEIRVNSSVSVPTVTVKGSETGNYLDFRNISMGLVRELRGAGGDDTIFDNDDKRIVAGDGGNDTLYGGGGTDTLSGDDGDDIIYGGDGDDIILFNDADEGFDEVYGGNGNDTILAETDGVVIGLKSTADVEVISANSKANVIISGGAGSDILDFSKVTLVGIAGIHGGNGFDTITGSSSSDNIYGGGGHDTIVGGAGDDFIDGGDGFDVVVYSGKAEDYIVDENNRTITHKKGVDGIDSYVGLEQIRFADEVRDLGGGGTNVAPEAPTDADTAADTIAENIGNGGVVGIKASALDADAGDSVQYELVDDAGGRFTINKTTGIVTVANASLIDFETSGGSYTIQVRAFDGLAYSATQTFTIAVTNVAPTAPRDAEGTATNNVIAENAAAGTAVANLMIVSHDAGGTPLTYTLDDASGKFELDVATGQIRLKDGQFLDFETNQSFTISVTASDGFTTSTAATFTITVGNIVEEQSYSGTSGADTWTAISDDNWTVDAQDGNDSITTKGGADLIRGGAGDDTLNAGAGNDIFEVGHGEGFDTFNGGAGFDAIRATADFMNFGIRSVTDVEVIDANGYSGVGIAGSTGNDTIDLTNATLIGIVGGIDGGAGSDLIRGTADADVIAGGTGRDTLYGNGGDDTFLYGPELLRTDADTFYGGTGFDQVVATGDFTAIGLGTFNAASSIELISSNGFIGVSIAGDDSANTYDFSATTLSGIEAIRGYLGADTITGSSGDDVIDGDGTLGTGGTVDGNDIIYGGDGNDIISGGSRNGYSGNDTFYGGNGDDTFLTIITPQVDRYYGGQGYDRILATENGARVVVGSGPTVNGMLDSIEEINANGFTGMAVEIQSYYSGSGWLSQNVNLSGVTLVGDVRIIGSAGNDTVTATNGNDIIRGEGGNDTLNGGLGDDTFLVNGTSAGADAFHGGDGFDVVEALSNNTVIGISAISGVERISAGNFTGVYIGGGAGNDTINVSGIELVGIGSIRGGNGNDVITGTSAGDIIWGEGGNDTLNGGAGDDIFYASDADMIDGGDGFDVLVAQANNASIGVTGFINLERISANGFTGVYVTGSTGNDTLNFSAIELVGIGSIRGGNGNDDITATAGNDVLWGDAGNDTLNGGEGNDTFMFTSSGSGFDVIIGGAGTDTIQAYSSSAVIGLTAISGVEVITSAGYSGVYVSGSTANDTLDFTGVTLSGITSIRGGNGDDTITGSSGNDTLFGEAGNDTLIGGDGNDTFQFYTTTGGFDFIDGGTGTDTIQAIGSSTMIGLAGFSGIETITSSGYSGVYISGTASNDTLDFTGVTLTGIASIRGGAGNDSLIGWSANDTLMGEDGQDTLTGGAGNDIFDFDAIGQSTVGAGADVITDFTVGADRVDLSTIDANAATAGNQAFTWIGSAAFSNVSGQLRYDDVSTPGMTKIFGDVNGDGVADFEIDLVGTVTLSATDFVL